MNRMQLLEYKRARYLLAFAAAPVTIHPVSQSRADKRKIPHWRVRSPLNCFPAVPDDSLDYEPTDYVVCHEYSLRLADRPLPRSDEPVALQGQDGQRPRDMMFEVLEYNDADETVLVACGSKPERQDGYGFMEERSEGSGHVGRAGAHAEPGRHLPHGVAGAHRPGQAHRSLRHDAPPVHVPGQDGRLRGTGACSARSSPSSGCQSHPDAPTRPKIIRDADAKQGSHRPHRERCPHPRSTLNPGAQVPPPSTVWSEHHDWLEEYPAEFGGESPTNVRTGSTWQPMS